MTPEHAETIALKAVNWLVGTEDILPVFLGATGSSPNDLRERLDDRAFLGGVLAFVTLDDAWVLSFCAEAGLAHDQPLRACLVLSGETGVDWA
ncbi:MAG: DUF3572 domain-containing protein [Rubellimicrobium sp.]|nr:DUF3572 domain-containing protein [Rubellimicrobium sp.]